MHVVRALWQLARPRTLIIIFLHAILFALILFEMMPEIWRIALVLVCLSSWYIHAVAINDLSDEETDRINLPQLNEDKDRPLINQTLSSQQLVWVSRIAALVFFVSASLVAWWLGIVAIVMIGLNVVYSMPPARLSSRGIVAQLTLPIGYVVLPFLVAVGLTHHVTISAIIVMIGLYALFVGRLFLKDIRDEKGDRQTGKLTYLVRHGLRRTLILSMIWILIGLVVMSSIMIAQEAALIIVLVFVTTGVLIGMKGAWSAKRLDDKLLYVAVVGRSSSAWLFSCCIVAFLAHLPEGQPRTLLILLITLGMFGFGIVSQFEEMKLTATRRAARK